MADRPVNLPFPTSAERHHQRLLIVEKALRGCLDSLDDLGLSLTAAHVDRALHQLYSDLADLRASSPGDPSSDL